MTRGKHAAPAQEPQPAAAQATDVPADAAEPAAPRRHGKWGAYYGKRAGAVVAAVVVVVVAAVAVASAYGSWSAGRQAQEQLDAERAAQASAALGADAGQASQLAVSDLPEAPAPAEPEPEPEPEVASTPLIARFADVGIHSPIAVPDITGVLFHQASYAWALVMETQLPQADAEAAYQTQSLRVNHGQTDGEWLDADAIHLWRTGEDTAMDTSIDVGAAIGTQVLAPVTGTVVLVCDYVLFEACGDIEIHIQPDGHPELDVVVLHTRDPLVAAGDHVEGGVTPLSTVRDITEIGGIQLDSFTPDGDPGCHAHVQVNDAEYEGYRDRKLQGAVYPS